MLTITDAERAFYESVMEGVLNDEPYSLSDLRLAYFLWRLDGGGGGGGGGSTAWADVTGKPASYPPTIGTTATTAVAGNDARLAKADTAVQPAGVANFVPNTRTVAGKPLTANVTLVKADVGLGNVDNTSDANKPISTAQAAALAGKVDGLNGISGLWGGTQAQYDAIGVPTPGIAYLITE